MAKGFLSMKILIVVTGTAEYPHGNLKTGLWLSEFTHIYHRAKERGYEISVANPQGDGTPVNPVSLKPILLDKLSAAYWESPVFRDMLRHPQSLHDVSDGLFDCVYLAGGHGSMFDFPDNPVLQAIIRRHFETGRTVCAICHGVCGLLNVRLSGGEYLVKDKKITGYSWFEESLARREKVVPFNLEAALKHHGADYRKALVPMTSKVVLDGNLITGQNPFSSKETAEAVIRHLDKQ